jgi:hypothetical protein
MMWIKLDSIEYQKGITRGGLPNGLYYKGNPILIIYENFDFFNIIGFLQLIKYYYAYSDEENDLHNFKYYIHNKIKISRLLEYIYSPNGEERVEVSNSLNETRFPLIWTYESELRICNPYEISKMENTKLHA